jgi:hypothetical protein
MFCEKKKIWKKRMLPLYDSQLVPKIWQFLLIPFPFLPPLPPPPFFIVLLRKHDLFIHWPIWQFLNHYRCAAICTVTLVTRDICVYICVQQALQKRRSLSKYALQCCILVCWNAVICINANLSNLGCGSCLPPPQSLYEIAAMLL